MRVLLDTCTFLWWMTDDPALVPAVGGILSDPDNACYLSTVSLWEILIKHAGGRIEIDGGEQSAFDYVLSLCQAADIGLLPMGVLDVRHVSQLPPLHRDPFDRMLICQAIEHALTLVTPDRAIRRYPIRTLWD